MGAFVITAVLQTPLEVNSLQSRERESKAQHFDIPDTLSRAPVAASGVAQADMLSTCHRGDPGRGRTHHNEGAPSQLSARLSRSSRLALPLPSQSMYPIITSLPHAHMYITLFHFCVSAFDYLRVNHASHSMLLP